MCPKPVEFNCIGRNTRSTAAQFEPARKRLKVFRIGTGKTKKVPAICHESTPAERRLGGLESTA